LDLERYAKTSYSSIERVLDRVHVGLREYFFSTPELIISYCVIIFNLIFLFWFNKQAFILLIIILLATILCARFINKYLATLEQNIQLCEDKLDQALAAFGLSFAMAVGLGAQNFMISRIGDLSNELRAQASKRAVVRAWAQIGSIGLSLALLWALSL